MKHKKAAAKKKASKKGGTIRNLKASVETTRRSSHPMEDVGSLYKPIKKPVTLRVDADVLAWFKKKGRGYQTRMNRVLRRVMMEERGE